MRRLLSILPKPSRYIGIEDGSVHKDPREICLRVVLAFPDLYEVGMSYLGQKILYGLINAHPHWWAERVFAPCAEASAILRREGEVLCSLESDTPLGDFDLIGFSLTHELGYTNVLYMLDLAGIPLYSADRLHGVHPLVIAGGGATLAAEPAAPFFDLLLLGDGEELLPELLHLLQESGEKRLDRIWLLEQAVKIPGVYAPFFFQDDGPRRPPRPLKNAYPSITRRIVASLDRTAYPACQVIPFGAVHNRLTLEIARGCTRGCRFCQAGMIYRPVREREASKLSHLLNDCLNKTGYEEISYLSLSTGDFSALKNLFQATVERCATEQVSVSLPSLRVGSIDDSIMEKMADIRRTGATLAPEAGSQRLRDVINKGITEEEIILHTRKLFEHGWQQIKLYFMIGLPSETDEDLLAIIDLCRKTRDAAGPGVKRLQVTAAISPFVPKAHTPFQWEAQASLEEITRRLHLLLQAGRQEKRIKWRWHKPEMSFLEGVLSRGDRRLAAVVERAYRKGAIFASWVDQFNLAPWLEALEEEGLDPELYLAGLPRGTPLPWDHLHSGLEREFLLKERERAFKGLITQDCRYKTCHYCGVCDTSLGSSALPKKNPTDVHTRIVNFQQRDQEIHSAKLDDQGRVIPRLPTAGRKNLPPVPAGKLIVKAAHYQIGYAKTQAAIYLSQLEIQSVLERAMRRGGLPLTFSQGFNPAPLISFARALPVGVASQEEWFSIYLCKPFSDEQILAAFGNMPRGLELTSVRRLPLNQRPPEAAQEAYRLEWTGRTERLHEFNLACSSLAGLPALFWTKTGKKQSKDIELRAHIRALNLEKSGTYRLRLDWSAGYVSPLLLTRAALGLSYNGNVEAFSTHEFLLTKLKFRAENA